MYKFPSISQFRNVVKYVKDRAAYKGQDEDGNAIYDHNPTYPVLRFHGTVKLHGTNASVVLEKTGGYPEPEGFDLYCQSRNNKLPFGGDSNHFGFVPFVEENRDFFVETLQPFLGAGADAVVMYGEWAGEGVQKGVAVSSLKKMFYIFAIKVIKGEESQWVYLTVGDPDKGIHHLHNFQHFELDIDFNLATASQNELVRATEAVEAQCPVAAELGFSGIGEGVVWKCVTPGYESSDYWFKVKGEKHSVTKVKKLAEVDTDKIAAIGEFITAVCTENRFNQGIEYLNEQGLELTQRSTGDFIRWVFNDVMKEEADVLEASGFTKKDLGSPLARNAKNWYFTKLDSMV